MRYDKLCSLASAHTLATSACVVVAFSTVWSMYWFTERGKAWNVDIFHELGDKFT
jgi:hypothetical protein